MHLQPNRQTKQYQRCYDVKTTSWRCFDIIMTLFLHRVSAGNGVWGVGVVRGRSGVCITPKQWQINLTVPLDTTLKTESSIHSNETRPVILHSSLTSTLAMTEVSIACLKSTYSESMSGFLVFLWLETHEWGHNMYGVLHMKKLPLHEQQFVVWWIIPSPDMFGHNFIDGCILPWRKCLKYCRCQISSAP